MKAKTNVYNSHEDDLVRFTVQSSQMPTLQIQNPTSWSINRTAFK